MNNCLNCGKETENPKFCSRSCAAIYNNKKYTKRIRRYSSCFNCGTKLTKFSQHKFCSTKCSAEFYSKQLIEKWISGEFPGASSYNPHLLARVIKVYLIKKNNYKCQNCGWGEINHYSNQIPLEVHHLDGDCTNNRPENLQVLCPNCHSLTQFHNSLNRGTGKGRASVEKKLGKN